MAKAKTRPTSVSAVSYIKAISDPARRKDCLTLLSLMKKAALMTLLTKAAKQRPSYATAGSSRA